MLMMYDEQKFGYPSHPSSSASQAPPPSLPLRPSQSPQHDQQLPPHLSQSRTYQYYDGQPVHPPLPLHQHHLPPPSHPHHHAHDHLHRSQQYQPQHSPASSLDNTKSTPKPNSTAGPATGADPASAPINIPTLLAPRGDIATFHGYLATVEDAMLVIEATNKGLCNRIKRRLQSKEHSSIKSGSVFVFDEEEANVSRATALLLARIMCFHRCRPPDRRHDGICMNKRRKAPHDGELSNGERGTSRTDAALPYSRCYPRSSHAPIRTPTAPDEALDR